MSSVTTQLETITPKRAAEYLKHNTANRRVRQALILDGFHRYKACSIIGIAPKFEEWRGQGGSILRFVIHRNLDRRHLDTGQRALLGVEIKKRLEAEGLERKREGGRNAGRSRPREQVSQNSVKPIDAQKEAAAMVGVSHDSISKAEHIAEQAPDLADAVKAGTRSLHSAHTELSERNGTHPVSPAGGKARITFQQDDPDSLAQAIIDKSKGDVEFVRQVWVELQEWDEHQAKTQEPLS